MSHWDYHNDSLSRSFCSTVPSSKPPVVRYTAVSSAKSRTCYDSFSGRLFMKTRNRIDPKTEPRGTPELTGTDPDSSPSITTVCDLLPRKAWIQYSAFPLIPYWWSSQMSFEWLTLSKAFRSSSIRSVFKKGEKYDAANYRPVSLTCICCKTLEHILVHLVLPRVAIV